METEEKKIRKWKIRNLARRLGTTEEEARKFLDEFADELRNFSKEAKIKVIGLDVFGTDRKME